jgi:MinD-like ATPase involved in chromosome partitioning or flagellar assembly
MYITTFYSFKGGVGRTMALVNVAVELANQGKQVLIVDFDLEAPGLDTFDLGRPDEPTPGVVDFVRGYLDASRAPDASDYVFESSDSADNAGRLWVMPSGSQDRGYAAKLASIDWNDLYEHHDGYLLFEDLKLQWRAALKPDYVLLDSRTGYTDVAGICTRHLPDAVVALFFPNDQNLRGLTRVVEDIRSEGAGPRRKHIDLHFVLSNVPDLDDEDEILDQKIAEFRAGLRFNREPLFIHRYQSLALLKQVIFTRKKPKSRLANQYRELMDEILRCNAGDRDGALDFIERFGVGSRRPPPGVAARLARVGRLPLREPDDQTTQRLEKIEELHSADGEILFRLGQLRASQGDFDKSMELLDSAIGAGYRQADAYLERAQQKRLWLEDLDAASKDASEALEAPNVSKPQIRRALRMLKQEALSQVSDSARELAHEEQERRLASAPPSGPDDLELLAMGHFSEALDQYRATGSDVSRMTIQVAFNYGMALWAQTGEPDPEPFNRVLELHASDTNASDANYSQCLAIAHWVRGDTRAAARALDDAAEQISTVPNCFSCWRYLDVPKPVFIQDLTEMLQLIDGDTSMRPRFMR